MKKFLILFVCLFSLSAFSQGVIFQNTAGMGKEKYIYGVDIDNPTNQELSGNRQKVSGTGFSAQLWVGTSESDLAPASESVFHFKNGHLAGVIEGDSNFRVNGHKGGDSVYLQVRVWDNTSGVTSWSEVIASPSVARGVSNMICYDLSGVDDDRHLHLGSGNLASAGLQSFALYVVPEPSMIALGSLGLGVLFLRRRK
jgi:hypothetical protein